MNWLRLYTEVLHDRKVQTLPGELFKTWINLLCLARLYDGSLPQIEDIAYALRLRPSEAATRIEKLNEAQLLDWDGECYRPHNWGHRQFESDNVTFRVRKFRQKRNVARNVSGNVSETLGETPPDTDSDTDTDTDSDTDADRAASAAHNGGRRTKNHAPSEVEKTRWFREEFWPIVWAKIGVEAALSVWLQRVQSREDSERIVEAAKQQGPDILAAAAERAAREGGKPRPLHPRTWLHQGRDRDVQPNLSLLPAALPTPRQTFSERHEQVRRETFMRRIAEDIANGEIQQ